MGQPQADAQHCPEDSFANSCKPIPQKKDPELLEFLEKKLGGGGPPAASGNPGPASGAPRCHPRRIRDASGARSVRTGDAACPHHGVERADPGQEGRLVRIDASLRSPGASQRGA